MSSPRRFEMVEGASSKFWEVKVEGSTFTVTYGRIGTAGTAKATSCASPEAAQSEADKLVREKTKKGYQEVGAAPTWRPPTVIPHLSHPDRFLNYRVTQFDPEGDPEEEGDDGSRTFPALRELERRAFRVGLTYDDDDDDFATRLQALAADPRVGELRALVIGGWFTEYCEEGSCDEPTALLERLAPKFTALEGLFLGDIVQEEAEISWIYPSDFGPLVNALPSLRTLVVRGGAGLRLQGLKHANLRSLTIQSGGLAREVVADVLAAELPELRELTLWLGADDYGGDTTPADFEALLAGGLFPKLEHLGLQDSPNADALAVAVAKSPLLGRLKGLDLSMGTLGDEGGEALLASPAVRGLLHLNLRYHYMCLPLAREFKHLGPHVDVSDRQEADDEDDRYIEVSE